MFIDYWVCLPVVYINYMQHHKMRVGGCDKTLEVSPLSSAASSGHMDMVSLLVQNEARINATPVSTYCTLDGCIASAHVARYAKLYKRLPKRAFKVQRRPMNGRKPSTNFLLDIGPFSSR